MHVEELRLRRRVEEMQERPRRQAVEHRRRREELEQQLRAEAAVAKLAFCEALTAEEEAKDAAYAKRGNDGARPSNAPPDDH